MLSTETQKPNSYQVQFNHRQTVQATQHVGALCSVLCWGFFSVFHGRFKPKRENRLYLLVLAMYLLVFLEGLVVHVKESLRVLQSFHIYGCRYDLS